MISIDATALTSGNIIEVELADTVSTDTPLINIEAANVDTATNVKLFEIETTVNTSGSGGFVFDVYGENDFKFVALDAAADQIIIGHHTAARYTTHQGF